MGKADADEVPTRLALVGTIQFVAAVQALRDDLDKAMAPLDDVDEAGDDALAKIRRGEIGVWRGKYDISVPQVRPLSPGEILGCTAPKLGDVDALIYVGDGRFHLESIMIANPSVPAFRFDPYSKKFTREYYEHDEMRSVRADAVRVARRNLLERGADSWAILLGTLGRQGSLSVMKTVAAGLPPSADTVPPLMVLLSEVSPAKLGLFSDAEISTFVQTSCPRLSIDWGYAFKRPLLSSYEASVAAGRITGWHGVDLDGRENGKGDYPMDYYAVSASVWDDADKPGWIPRAVDAAPPATQAATRATDASCGTRTGGSASSRACGRSIEYNMHIVQILLAVVVDGGAHIVVEPGVSESPAGRRSHVHERRHDLDDGADLVHEVTRRHLVVSKAVASVEVTTCTIQLTGETRRCCAA